MSVSIIMPMLNPGVYLEAAVHSVLSQTYRNLELIIIDDGCTDNSRNYLDTQSDERIVIVDGPKRGIAAALNAGIKVATGDLLMRCDADDLFTDKRIENQVLWMDSHPEYIAVCGQFAATSECGKIKSMALNHHLSIATDINDELNKGHSRTSLCTFAIRRAAVERSGGFREWFKTSEDIDFSLRISEFGRVRFLPTLYYLYRLHSYSTTHRQQFNIRSFFEQSAISFRMDRTATGSDSLQRDLPPLVPEVQRSNESTKVSAKEQLVGILHGQAWRLNSSGKTSKSILVCLNAVRHSPYTPTVWKTLLKIIAKSCIRVIQKS